MLDFEKDAENKAQHRNEMREVSRTAWNRDSRMKSHQGRSRMTERTSSIGNLILHSPTKKQK